MRTLMSTAEVARVLNLTPASVRLLARRARLRIAVVTVGGVRLFDPKDVERMRRARAPRLAAPAAPAAD